MINVLQIVAPAVADSQNHRGVNGPERRAANLISQWQDYKVKPVVMYPAYGRLYGEFVASGCTMIDDVIRSKFDFAGIWRILRHIKVYNIVLIHTQGPGSLDMMASIAAKIAGIPIVVTRPVMMRDLRVPKYTKMIYKAIDKLTLKLATKLVAVSSQGLAILKSERINPDKLELIYNGVETNQPDQQKNVQQLRASWGLQEGTFAIGMAAQLTTNKGWFDFIEMVENLKVYPIHGFIIGDGPLKSALKQTVLDKGLEDKITFTDHLNNLGETILPALDVYAMTSYREGLSVAVLEAMSAKLPLILYDFSGSYDQVEPGENGFIVKTGDIDSMVKKIIHIMENDLFEAYGKQSYQRYSERFTQTKMVDRYQALYHDLIKD